MIAASGVYVPERVVPNSYFNDLLGEDVDTWLVQNLTIRERRWCSETESTADLCEKAARLTLTNAAISPEEIDLLIIATDTPEYISPSTASVVQHRLGAKYAGTFDVNTACAGFVTALDIAAKYIRSDEQYENVLVVGAYAMSKYLDLHDKKTVTLFADGAGAALLKAEETSERGFLASELLTEGQYHDWMGIYAGGSAWYLYDRGQGEGGVSILGQGFNSLLVDYNGGARFQLGQNRYKGDVLWAGANVSYNREFIGGRVWASAMTMVNVGNLNIFTPQGASAGNVGIFGITAHASFNYKYGQTNNDRINLEAIYTSGDANNVSDGQYTGVVTGNTWGSPVGIFSSHRAFLLFPDVQVVNRYYSAVHDISNMGFGTTAVFLNYFNNIVPNKVLIKVGTAVALANQTPSGVGRFIGAEANAELKYSLALFLDLGVSAAYMINGDFYDSPLTRPADLGTRPKNPWAVFSTISWLMF